MSVGGTFDAWPVSVWSSHPGVTALAGKDRGKLTVRVAADAEPGIAWLRLHDKQGASALRAFVVGTLPEIEEKEPNDEASKAQRVAGAVVVNGRLARAGDVDCFAVTLTKGQVLTTSLLASRTLRSPMDGVLQVASADGFVLEQSNDVLELDPHLAFTAPRAGTYLVRVFAFPAMPDASVRFMGAETYIYRLTLTTAGYVEHAWPLAVPRDRPGTVELAGRKVAVPPTPGPHATVWHPEVTGTASVRVEPHPCVLADSYKEQAPPFTLSGRIERPGQVASFAFPASKGKALVARVEVAGVESGLTPLVRVLGPDGKQVARAEAARPTQDVEATFTPAADGTYRVEVSDLYRGASRGWYRLRLTPPEPDFVLSVPADRFTVAPGKSADVVVTVARKNGYKGEVALSVEGLPAGVTASVTKPPAADGKATLRLTAAQDARSGVFRVVGTGAGLDQPRVAEAGIAADGATSDLWLTVGPVPGK